MSVERVELSEVRLLVVRKGDVWLVVNVIVTIDAGLPVEVWGRMNQHEWWSGGTCVCHDVVALTGCVNPDMKDEGLDTRIQLT